MIQKWFIAIFLMLSVQVTLHAEEYVQIQDLQTLEAKVAEYSAKVQTIKSDFVQVKHLDALEVTIESTGTFAFKKENSLRWEYTQPYTYLIVSHDGKFTIKDSKKKSEYDTESNQAFKEINKMIVSSVRGNLLMDGNFDVTAFEDSKSYKIILVPKLEQMGEILSTVEMYFDKTDMSVFKVRMIEDEEDYTEIQFNNRVFNEEIPAHTFIVD